MTRKKIKRKGCSSELVSEVCRLLESKNDFEQRVKYFKKIMIEKSLKENNFDIRESAKVLKISKSKIYREISYFGINKENSQK